MKPIYLDHNATSPLDPDVAQAVCAAYRADYANPESPHRPGQRARRAWNQALRTMASILGAAPAGRPRHRIVLTSGGTEANHLAIFGLAGRPPARVLVSAIEHPSVLRAAERLAAAGFDVHRIPVDPLGRVSIDRLDALLTPDTRLVSVMAANNETGVIQPHEQIARLCAQRRVAFHTDAVQWVGKLPVDFDAWRATAASFSAHKFHGPQGIGGLLVRADATLEPQLVGGQQQAGLRAGSQCVALALGLARALQRWEADPDRAARLAGLRDRFERRLLQNDPQLVVIGQPARRVPHTSQLAFPGIDRQALLIALDLAGVAASSGSACSSGSTEPSAVLRSMGLAGPVVNGAVRFSLGATTTAEELDQAADRILNIVNNLRRRPRRRNSAPPSRVAGEKPL